MSARGPIRATRGTERSCKGWVQEAALRMLMNNLDPEVAERPEDLVVYGGIGKAARNWAAFDAIVKALKELEDDETLLVQSGKPVGIVRTHRDALERLVAVLLEHETIEKDELSRVLGPGAVRIGHDAAPVALH